ncbi:MAG: type IV secretory system conjugative DNA transfer family protein, partial [Acidimicrobiales bacterium]
VLGPPRSGKTSCVVVPAVLHAGGPVVVTSTKADVMRVTARARGERGRCMLFDPSGSVRPAPGVEPVAWSPLVRARTWDKAFIVADQMVQTARPGTDRGDASHWSGRATELLAVALHAAALDDMPVRRMISAIERRDVAELRLPLARDSADLALGALSSILLTDSREQSGIWSTASGVLAGYRSEAALSSTSGSAVDESFLDAANTLYVCAASDHQRMAAPLVVGMLWDLTSAAYDRSEAREAGERRSEPPLLLALDELANIAPLPSLPKMLAEGGSQGVVILGCLQDLSQARARWRLEADGFLTLFGTKLLLAGIGDTRTLEAVSQLVGDVDVHMRSVSSSPPPPFFGRGQSTHTDSTRRERRLPVDLLARGEPGYALMLEGAHPSVVGLVPWFKSIEMRAAVEGRQVCSGSLTRSSQLSRTPGHH